MDQPQDRIGAPFEPATEPARLRKVSRPILRLIFNGTIAATPPNPAAALPSATSSAIWASTPTATATPATRSAGTSREGFQ
jgi:hypothetical protein